MDTKCFQRGVTILESTRTPQDSARKGKLYLYPSDKKKIENAIILIRELLLLGNNATSLVMISIMREVPYLYNKKRHQSALSYRPQKPPRAPSVPRRRLSKKKPSRSLRSISMCDFTIFFFFWLCAFTCTTFSGNTVAIVSVR